MISFLTLTGTSYQLFTEVDVNNCLSTGEDKVYVFRWKLNWVMKIHMCINEYVFNFLILPHNHYAYLLHKWPCSVIWNQHV